MAAAAHEEADFQFVISLVYQRSRIRLHDGKHALIRARLGKRMRHHGFESFHRYCEFLRRDGTEEEITHVVDALTTNFTGFLREPDHFEFLVKDALPALLQGGPRRFRIWSSACATGEEPYSMAFYLAEHFPVAAGWDWQIDATDISTRALDAATRAIYSEERVTGLPVKWLHRYFQRGHGDNAGQVRLKSWVRERVRFQQLNLLSDFRFNHAYETIFCRNVMIYFDRDTQRQLVEHLRSHLAPRGYLITGHSESLNGIASGLRCLRPSIYQKET